MHVHLEHYAFFGRVRYAVRRVFGEHAAADDPNRHAQRQRYEQKPCQIDSHRNCPLKRAADEALHRRMLLRGITHMYASYQ
ncbi:hypothetical protein SDC9_190337 [bioreactor metagenome]|uniref:Uncharacterized protein n=1 Tax=bioreactor metagenome TaxID=1076179 RepID=A0A645HX65_9ZZZZ